MVFPASSTKVIRFSSFVLSLSVTVTWSAVPVVSWFKVGKVQFCKSPEAGVPSAGVTRVGLVANTRAPVPVSSEIVPRSSEDVVDANTFSLSATVVIRFPVPRTSA